MSLQINLMFESEKRSGSLVSLKFSLRFLAFVVPLALALALGALLMSARAAREHLRQVELEQSSLAPTHQTILKLRQTVDEYRGLAAVLDGWHTSRGDWYTLLGELQQVIPASIQLLRLSLNEKIIAQDNYHTRSGSLLLQGRVTAECAERDVRLLETALQQQLPAVAVKRFAADDAVDKNMRIFEMEASLATRAISRAQSSAKQSTSARRAPTPATVPSLDDDFFAQEQVK